STSAGRSRRTRSRSTCWSARTGRRKPSTRRRPYYDPLCEGVRTPANAGTDQGESMSTGVDRQQDAPASDKVWSIETNGINPIPTLFSYVSLVGWETYLVAIATLGAVGILERLGWLHGTLATAVSLVIIAGVSVVIGLLGHATIVRIQMWFTWAFAILTVFF